MTGMAVNSLFVAPEVVVSRAAEDTADYKR